MMISHVKVNPNDVLTYHETGDAPDKTEKISHIKSTDNYATLKTSIQSEGIKDPIIIRCEPNRVYVEVGEQRILIARELELTEIDAIAYTFQTGTIPANFQLAKNCTTQQDVEDVFSRQEFDQTTSGVCPLCSHDSGEQIVSVTVPALKTIRDYIQSGIATK